MWSMVFFNYLYYYLVISAAHREINWKLDKRSIWGLTTILPWTVGWGITFGFPVSSKEKYNQFGKFETQLPRSIASNYGQGSFNCADKVPFLRLEYF